jgi:transcription elongation GreA/GreB family factor
MSRVFVKQAEDKVEDFPDRAIPASQFGDPAGRSKRLSRASRKHTGDHKQRCAGREVRLAGPARKREVIRQPAERDTASFGTTVTLRRDDGRE